MSLKLGPAPLHPMKVSGIPGLDEQRPAIKVEFHMPADQYDRFRQMAVDLDMTGAEFCRRAVIGEMDAREGAE